MDDGTARFRFLEMQPPITSAVRYGPMLRGANVQGPIRLLPSLRICTIRTPNLVLRCFRWVE